MGESIISFSCNYIWLKITIVYGTHILSFSVLRIKELLIIALAYFDNFKMTFLRRLYDIKICIFSSAMIIDIGRVAFKMHKQQVIIADFSNFTSLLTPLSMTDLITHKYHSRLYRIWRVDDSNSRIIW